MEQDRALDEYAARQYGVFSRDQARSAGLTRKMIETRLGSGAWIRLGPAVYALASAPPKWERQMAAALLTKRDAIVAGRAAAHLHDFDGFKAPRPVIMIDRSQNASSPLAKVIRSGRFESVRRVRRQGFIVTDEAETVMTLARDLSPDRLEWVVDSLLARKSCSVDQLTRVTGLSDKVPGVARLRPIIEYRSPDAYQPPTTELERLLFKLLDHPQLPDYTRQMPMPYHRIKATVDAYIAIWRLIVEGDGRRWHTRRADYERDRLRDNEATAHGYAVLRFTYEMLRDRPEECRNTLLRTGRARTSV
ncbi:MAG TPA: type IV toxin-antitoxin system AbiEi family antitoxin domain-containing protein [Acidimicrobiia bacterium]|nr:type IV toxin-antitoxin system AbiEi family antitoxin domain-containing protein [Acidimicrobiia bacterium]